MLVVFDIKSSVVIVILQAAKKLTHFEHKVWTGTLDLLGRMTTSVKQTVGAALGIDAAKVDLISNYVKARWKYRNQAQECSTALSTKGAPVSVKPGITEEVENAAEQVLKESA